MATIKDSCKISKDNYAIGIDDSKGDNIFIWLDVQGEFPYHEGEGSYDSDSTPIK